MNRCHNPFRQTLTELFSTERTEQDDAFRATPITKAVFDYIGALFYNPGARQNYSGWRATIKLRPLS